MLEGLAHGLVRVLSAVRCGGLDSWLEEWRRRDRTGGTRYRLDRDGTVREVTALRVELPAGNLIVADDDGKEHAVTSYTELAVLDE